METYPIDTHDKSVIILTGTNSIGSNLLNLLLKKKKRFFLTGKFCVNSSSLRILKNVYKYDFCENIIYDIDTKEPLYNNTLNQADMMTSEQFLFNETNSWEQDRSRLNLIV